VVAGLSPGLFYMRPTQAAIDLAASMVRGLQAGRETEATLLTRAALAPAHAETSRDTRVRLLPFGPVLAGRAVFALPAHPEAPAPASRRGRDKRDAAHEEDGEEAALLSPRGDLLRRHGTVAVHVGGGAPAGERLLRLEAFAAYGLGRPRALEALPADSGGAGLGPAAARALKKAPAAAAVAVEGRAWANTLW
jgi:hypothetical protein